MEGFDLVQVHQVMNHPEVIVVVHRHVQSLHGFASNTTFGNSSINLELGGHEILVLALNLSDDIWGVNLAFIGVPIDGSHSSGAFRFLVVKIKNRLELGVLLSGFIVICGNSKSVEPFSGEFIVSRGSVDLSTIAEHSS